MKKYINRLLNDYKAPLINSIIFPNGNLLVIESKMCEDEYEVRVLCVSSIKSYFDYNSDDDISDYDILTTFENDKYKVYAGEGSYGSEGFIYVINKSNSELLWFLFLDNSNPFNKVSIHEDDIIAHSTLGKIWKIPIFTPEKLKNASSD